MRVDGERHREIPFVGENRLIIAVKNHYPRRRGNTDDADDGQNPKTVKSDDGKICLPVDHPIDQHTDAEAEKSERKQNDEHRQDYVSQGFYIIFENFS